MLKPELTTLKLYQMLFKLFIVFHTECHIFFDSLTGKCYIKTLNLLYRCQVELSGSSSFASTLKKYFRVLIWTFPHILYEIRVPDQDSIFPGVFLKVSPR